MDVPIYKLDLHENSFGFDKNPNKKGKKSSSSHNVQKDSSDSNLFSQESLLNASNDKNESFWQSLRNLWRKKDCDEASVVNGNNLYHIISKIMTIIDQLENNVNDISSKVNSIESIINIFDNKVIKDVLKSTQSLNKKSEKTKIQCTDILSDMEFLKEGINSNLIAIQSAVESEELRNNADEISNDLSAQILMKFQSILENCLSELSADILVQWNDVLYNIYSDSSTRPKKKKEKHIKEIRKSPGNFLINSLRRSERLQNRNDLELTSFNRKEIMLIKENRFENIPNKSKSTKKVLPSKGVNNPPEINSHKSIPIKRSLEIFKYYEESQSDLISNEKQKLTNKRSNVKIFKKDKSYDMVISANSCYDSEADLISLRKLFNC